MGGANLRWWNGTGGQEGGRTGEHEEELRDSGFRTSSELRDSELRDSELRESELRDSELRE